MSIEKRYLKTKEICKVTFKLSPEESGDAQSAFLVGEFNDWDLTSLPMRKRKDGTFRIVVDLPVGHTYQFRYFLDNERWANDWSADAYRYSEFGNCENSVVEV